VPADRVLLQRALGNLIENGVRHGGVGLGLSLARAIAEAHGGSLRLLPSEKGATFELLVPAAGSV
jgi:signal transduction histidine kinase